MTWPYFFEQGTTNEFKLDLTFNPGTYKVRDKD